MLSQKISQKSYCRRNICNAAGLHMVLHLLLVGPAAPGSRSIPAEIGVTRKRGSERARGPGLPQILLIGHRIRTTSIRPDLPANLFRFWRSFSFLDVEPIAR